jgi:deoxyribodipyrimidine photolyase
MLALIEVRAHKSKNMEEQAKTTEKRVLINLADKLLEVQSELDELTLQFVLGKADAKEKFEEIKNQFRIRLVSLRRALSNQKAKNLSGGITVRLDEVERELDHGKVEDKEMFHAQKKYIMKALATFETEIRKRLPDNLDVQHFFHDIESFKYKLEILQLKFMLKRFTLKDEIKSNVDEVRKKVSDLVEGAREQVISGEKKIAGIKKEVNENYLNIESSLRLSRLKNSRQS